MRETWYVLENGAIVPPRDVALDPTGILRHRTGVAVSMLGDQPWTRIIDVRNDRHLSAEDGNATYKTR